MLTKIVIHIMKALDSKDYVSLESYVFSVREHILSLRDARKPPVKLVSQLCRGHLTGATHLKTSYVRKTHFDNRPKHSSPHVWLQHASIQQTDCEGGFNQLLTFSSADDGAHMAPASGAQGLWAHCFVN